MHALRVHCGSFLYDNLRQQWISEEERQEAETARSSEQSPSSAMSTSGVEGQREAEEKDAGEGEEQHEEKEYGLPKEWPLFETSALATIRVTSFKNKQGTIYYVVQPTLEGFHWSVEKTFLDFSRLHKALVECYDIDRALLPSRKLFGYFGQPKSQHLVEMQEKLDHLLKAVLQRFPVPPVEMLDFCGYPFCDVLSVTQSLALYFFQEGERVLAKNKAVHMSPTQLHCINHRMILPMASSGTGSLRDDFGNLLDFIMRLKKLKVAPSTEETFTLLPSEHLTFELTLMKSLTFLMIDSIDLKDLQERQTLTTQLEGLDVRRSLSSLNEILVVYPADSALPPPTSPDLSMALQWKCLKTVCLKLNNIKSIDKSLHLLPNLERLDLSYNSIRKIENLAELPHLQVVDLSHNKISDIPDLHTRIGKISKLGLAHNQLPSLAGMAKCFSLQYIDVSYNLISEVTEVYHLSGLTVLEDLHLIGNPIHQSPSYRSLVFSQLPSTESNIALDSKKASQDELELSASMAGVKGHKRVPSRTADIKPDRDEFVTREARSEFEDSTSVTTQLEEMRKTGGEKWLSIFNAERTKHSAASTSHPQEDVVARSPKERRKKVRKHHQHHSKHAPHRERLEGSYEHDITPPLVSRNPFPVEVEDENLSKELLQEIQTLQQEKLQLTNFPVTVLEYAGPLHTLSSQDVDQMLLHSPLEECMVTVDTTMMRVLEVVLSTNKTRSQRDLALLEDIRFHEGKKRGVCLRFSQFSGSPLWVIYCVRNTETLARLYVAVHQGLQSTLTPQGSGSVASGTSTPDLLVSEETDNVPVNGTHPQGATGIGLVTELHSKLSNEGQAREGVGKSAAFTHPLQQSTELTPATHLPPPEKTAGSRTSASPSPHSQSPRSQSPAAGAGRASETGGTNQTSPAKSKISASEEREEGKPVSRADKWKTQSGPRRSTSPAPPVPTQQTGAIAGGGGSSRRQPSPGPGRGKVELTPASQGGTAGAEPQEGRQLTPNPEGASLSASLTAGKDCRPLKLTTGTRKIVKKPGLERQSLVDFFNGKVAREQKEVLMNIVWGGASLTSAPGCEIEVGLFISDKGLYLLQVLDAEKNPSQALSWYTENAPLIASFYAHHLTLLQVRMGIFDQSITFQCIEKGALKSLVMYPRTYESIMELIQNLKAALDASGSTHITTTMQESILSPSSESSNVLFMNPDMSDMQKLKESLVRPKVVAQICSNAMNHMHQRTLSSFSEDTKRVSEDLAAKFEIVQYVMVSEISSDLLPISNGSVHFRPRVLVLTNKAIHLCKDEIASWPTDANSPVSPPFPRYYVLDSYPIEAVAGIEICDKAQALVSISDPIYEFRISFQTSDETHSLGSSREWQLCVYDRQYIDQFFTCLSPLWSDTRQSQLPITHTTEPLTAPATSTSPHEGSKRTRRLSAKSGATSYNPSFFESQALTRFASLTSSERFQFFREHVSEAQFMKSDEVPLSIFLALCSVSKQEYTQIEVCVVASNYAIYLLSDVENIHRWLDKGGPSSFSRMSLLSKQGASKARCFFRLWINEIKELQMGFFYLAMQLTAAKADHSFTIHSQDASAMLSLLSALSCSANLRNAFEEKVFTELLSDYIDLGSHSLSSKAKQAHKNVKLNIEFLEPTMDNQETLKQILLCISPSIRKSSTIEQSTSGLQIILGQIMLMIEEVHIRDSHSVQYQLRLVLLSNYGLFVCAHSAGEHCTPAVLQPTDLQVKRWCHIDLIDHVEVVSQPRFLQCTGHIFSVILRAQKGADAGTMTLATQNSEQLSHFLYCLSLLWYERSEKQLPIIRV